MAFCLIKEQADKFKAALRSGDINPVSLAQMDSPTRRKELAKYVGDENAQQVNALFESKLLLKNQQAGMVAWAKSVIGIPKTRRQEMIDRIEKMQNILDPKDEVFLQDLASTRLKIDVSKQEAKNIADLSKAITEKRAKADENGKFPSEDDRLAFGAAKVALEEYVNDLKLQAGKTGILEDPIGKVKRFPIEVASFAKSALASLDNSFFGRQGIKVLANQKTWNIWTRNFMKSWDDIQKELRGIDALALIRADIYSRPNALNGKYRAMNLGLEALNEEAYPSSLPEKIPAFGRLFKASQSAYNGAALKMRADLADYYIKLAEDAGINMNDPKQAAPIGNIIGSMTGKGRLPVSEGTAEILNVLFFSPKFLKANFDTLTAHLTDEKMTPFAKKLAAENLLRIIITYASIFMVANLLDPDSVEEDPRSPNFGKLKLWGNWVDITGGMGQLVTLVSRIIPTRHNGEWAFWTKNKAGVYKKLGPEEFGGQDPVDVLVTFFEGKLSPAAKTVTTIWRQQDYQGEKPTPESIAKSIFVPIPAQNIPQLAESPESSFVIGSVILDLLGFSTTSTVQPNTVTKQFEFNKNIPLNDVTGYVVDYADALNQNPEKVYTAIFSGQELILTSKDTVIIRQIPEGKETFDKQDPRPKVRLDLTVPKELGGKFTADNVKLIKVGEYNKNSGVEKVLIKAVEDKKLSKEEARKLLIEFKNGIAPEKYIRTKYE